MENKKSPAFPREFDSQLNTSTLDGGGWSAQEIKDQTFGLTKLEYASIQAMKGILANSREVDTDHIINMEKLANCAIMQAKELLKQLSQEE